MQTSTSLPPSAKNDGGFAVRRQPAAASVVAALTLVLAFALSTYVVVAGWPL